MSPLIFIPWRDLDFLPAQEGKSGSIYLVKMSPANASAFHKNPDRIYTELTLNNPKSA